MFSAGNGMVAAHPHVSASYTEANGRSRFPMRACWCAIRQPTYCKNLDVSMFYTLIAEAKKAFDQLCVSSRLVVLSLSNGCLSILRRRYTDVPSRVRDETARFPFLRARLAGHLFLLLMERVRTGSTKNANCQSLYHWWGPSDAIPFQNSDEAEQAENGRRKACVSTLTSAQII